MYLKWQTFFLHSNCSRNPDKTIRLLSPFIYSQYGRKKVFPNKFTPELKVVSSGPLIGLLHPEHLNLPEHSISAKFMIGPSSISSQGTYLKIYLDQLADQQGFPQSIVLSWNEPDSVAGVCAIRNQEPRVRKKRLRLKNQLDACSSPFPGTNKSVNRVSSL